MVCVKETKIKHNIGYIYSRKMQYLPIMRRGLSLAEYYIQNYTKYVGYKCYFFITFTLLILQARICVHQHAQATSNVATPIRQHCGDIARACLLTTASRPVKSRNHFLGTATLVAPASTAVPILQLHGTPYASTPSNAKCRGAHPGALRRHSDTSNCALMTLRTKKKERKKPIGIDSIMMNHQ